MSIEDPRLSGFDNNASADDFDSAVEQHLGYVPDETRSVEVAQANTPAAPTTDRLPAETAAAVIPTEVVPDANNVVTLPVGVSIDDIRLEGGNLVLVQADGTEIVIVGGAANIPTFVIGEVELPQQALFAALEGSDINVAQGPDGSYSASSGPASDGGDFDDSPINNGPEQFALADLLGDTSFDDGIQNGQRLGGDGEPDALDMAESFIFDEVVLADNIEGNQTISGTLTFDPGPDFGTISAIGWVGAGNVDEATGTAAGTGLTSGGNQVFIRTTAAPTDGTILSFVALEGYIVVDGVETVVFTVTVDNRVTGDFTFELIGQLDHPDAGESGVEDLLRLGFTFTVTDLDGDSDTATFNIDVKDDAPTFGEASNGSVDEDYLDNGNVDGEGEVDDDDLPPVETFAKVIADSGTTASGSLGINWGADKGNATENGGITNAVNDRGVAFTQATLDALLAKGYTSDGVALQYALSADGTTIIAYKPYGEEDGGEKRLAAFAEDSDGISASQPVYSGEAVFAVSVSDVSANGSYEFELIGNLDHPDGSTEDDITIEFDFTAQDSDGDSASSSFTVTVNDDSPVIGTPTSGSVDEDYINGNVEKGEIPAPELQVEQVLDVPVSPVSNPAHASGSLGISWGADNGNAGGNAGLTDVVNDRGVSFTQATIDALEGREQPLTADGVQLKYVLSEDGTTLYAYKPAAVVDSGDETKIVAFVSEVESPLFDGELVFTVSVSDISDNGTYDFQLYGNLDHPSAGEDDLSIEFEFTVQDGDGDTASSSFEVSVNDDTPVIYYSDSGSVAETVAEVSHDVELDNDSFETQPLASGDEGVYVDPRGNYTMSAPTGWTITGGAGGVFAPTSEVISSVGHDGTNVVWLREGAVLSQTTDETIEEGETYTVRLNVGDRADQAFGGGEVHIVATNGTDTVILATSVFSASVDGGWTSVEVSTAGITAQQAATLAGYTIRIDVVHTNPGDGNQILVDDITLSVGAPSVVDSTSGSLGIQWGSDNGNSIVDGGFNGTQINGDRSVVFGNASGEVQGLSASVVADFVTVTGGNGPIALDTLTSNGKSLVFTLSEDGTVLTASAGGETVFTVSLSDVDNGSYDFDLIGVLDHPVDASGEAGLDDLTFNFTYTSRDGDGDAVTGNFSVDVQDDMPVRGEEVRGTVEDEAVNGGNNEDDGLSAVATGALKINWGADDGDSDLGTVGGPHVDGDRTVVFSTDVVTVNGAKGEVLTSLGQQVSTVIVGGVLIGYTGELAPTSIEDKSVVFHATLSDDGTGSYTFTLVQPLDHASGEGVGTENELSLTFGYTATDADGDTVSGSFTVDVVDDVATIGKPYSDGVVEEEQAQVAGVGNDDTTGTGEADQSGDLNVTTQTTGGSLDISWGSDNANSGSADRSVQFANVADPNLTSRGAAIHYTTITVDGQSVLLAYTGAIAPTELPATGEAAVAAHVVFSVALSDADAGSYTFNLYDTLDHATAGGENAIDLSFQFTATDSDGDTTAPATISVKVIDDVPVATGSAVTVTADEDDIYNFLSQGTSPDADSQLSGYGLGWAASVSGSVATVVSFGADGAAAAGGFSLTSDAASTMATLGLTSKGGTLSYVLNGNTIIAYVNVGGGAGLDSILDRPVFSLELNASTGEFVYKQYDQLDHADGNGENTDLNSGSTTVDGINFGAIINATDGDGDVVNLDGKVTVKVVDDIPQVSIRTDDTVTIDETVNNQNDDTKSSSVASLFVGVANKGSDVDMPLAIYAKDDVVDTSYDRGTDDNAQTSLTLQIDSTDSGLTTTDGQPITLSLENGIVVGRVPAVGGEVVGKAAFAITINANGEVSVAQYISIKHSNTASTDEGVNLSGKISAVFSVTDYDKDTVTQSISIGDKIVFEDDAPVQTSPATTNLTLNEDDLIGGNDEAAPQESLTASGNLNVALGADGGSFALSATNATWNGETKTLEANDHSWKVTLGNNGAYTFELMDNTLAHGPTNNGQNVLDITIGYTATDGDGDVLTGNFTVKIVDDVPVTVVGDNENRRLDEDDIKTSQATGTSPGDFADGDGSYTGGPGQNGVGGAFIDGSLAHLVKAGADGGLSFGFTSDAASILQAQGLKSEGAALSYEVKGNVLYGYANTDGTTGYGESDRVVFKLTLNANGSYQFELVDQLDHTAPATAGTSVENLLTINLGAALQATDADGDSVKLTGLVNFEVKDDAPVQTAPATTGLTLNEDDLIGGNDEASPKESLTASGNLNVALGADGGSIALSASNATWNSETKTLEANDHSWKVTLGNNGAYTFELMDNTLAHGPANDGQDVLDINIGYTATDGDGDVLTGSFTVKIEDDVPVAVGETATVRESAPTTSGNNLIFAFDVSGSMSDGVTGWNSPSRLQVAKDAAINIINASNAALVLIVTFQDNAQASVWMSKADALNYIQNSIPNPNGGTDYDDAIDAIKGVPLVGGTTNVYFFSDGQVSGNDELSTTERQQWEAYLNQNGINSYAVGVGSYVSSQDDDLKDVAYPGEPITITSGNDATLLATAPVATDLSTASGNVLANDSFGADGGRIQSITVGGVTYTWDGANTITVSTGGTITGSSLVNQTTTLGGKLSFDFTNGHWSYTGPAELVTDTNETVSYTLVDGDGDTATASLVIGVQAVNDAPVNTVPASLTVLEDQTLVITGLSVGDVDANGADITVKLEVEDGKLTLATTNGLTSVSGNNSGTITLTGSVAEIQAALNGMTYKGALNFNGTDQLKITTTDNGNTGIGGAKTDTDTVNITVTAVNDAPVMTPDANSITFTENGSAKNLFGNVEIDDVDNPSNFSGGKVTISLGGTEVSGDQLVLNDSDVRVENGEVQIKTGGGYHSTWTTIGTIGSGNFGGTSVVVNLNSYATEDRVEQLLEAVAFKSTSEDPTGSTRTVTVTFDDGDGTANGGASTDSSTITVNVVPVNDAPVFGNDNNGEREFSINENTSSVGSVSATDVDGGALTYSILNNNGTDYAKFTINADTGAISFISAPNYEDAQDVGGIDNNNRYEIDVKVSDGKGGYDVQHVEVVVNNVNEAPTAVDFKNVTSSINENVFVGLGIKVADIAVTDDALGNETLSLSGADAGSFAIVGNSLYYTGSSPNFEAKSSYSVDVLVNDPTVGATPDLTKTFTLAVNDVNEAPTAIDFTNVTSSINENVSVGAGIKVADIAVTDDALGTETLSLSGADAGSFTIVGNSLYYTGSSPNFEAKSSYSVNVLVNDPTVGVNPDLTKTFTLAVNDVPEGPTVQSITMSDTALRVGETSSVTITFSEMVKNFSNSDVTVENGLLSTLSSADGGKTWTAIFTPTANIEDATNVIKVGTAYADLDGNAGTAGTSGNYAIDTAAPVVSSILMSDTAVRIGDTPTVTITFSEKVTGFSNDDVSVQNGTLGTLTTADEGKTWTATFTPSAPIEDATNVVKVLASYADTAGNSGSGATSGNYSIDTTAPVVSSILVSDTAVRIGDTPTVTITFSEKVTGFSNSDVTVQNGTLGTLTTSDGGKTWTATFTPSVPIEDATNVVTVLASYADTAGNSGSGATSGNYSIDTTAPTANIVIADTNLTAGETSVVTITFSEPVTGLTTADFTVQNGGLTNLTSGDGGKTWTATLTPTASVNDTTNVITLNNSGYSDTAGNAGSGSTSSANYVVNTVAPLAATATYYNVQASAGPSFNSAYNLNGLNYVKSNDPDVTDPTNNPSVTLAAKGSNNSTDYYKIDVTADNTFVRLDVDNANFDSVMAVYRSNGTVVASNDDYAGEYSSYLELTLSVGTYYIQIGSYNSAAPLALGDLGNSSVYELQVSVKAPGTDPIVLDLDHNGFAFSSVENGVSFDIDADGKADQVAWTSDDGILAYDVNGDGKIDNGSEIFTPSFNGGTYASGVAALASLDSNGDGKIDANDAAFEKLTVWVDANNNGISDEGELSSLTDHHVASISLTTDTTGGTEDGQTIFGEGSFTFDDGSTGEFVEVGFDTIFGSDASDALTVVGTDGDDVLHGGMGQVFLTGGAGADTFVFDETALSDLDVADVITDFSSDQGDQLDVSALLDSLLGEQLTAETAASHLKATVVGNDTTVSVQTGADTWKDVAVLQNHTEGVKILFDDHQAVTVHHD